MSSLQIFASMAALFLVFLCVMVLAAYGRQAMRGPVYLRTKTYKTRDKHHEFKVLGIANFEDLEDFITFLVRTFNVRILEEDRELDDMVWIIGRASDWVEVHYDDHDGARLRSPKKSRGILFSEMEKRFKTKR